MKKLLLAIVCLLTFQTSNQVFAALPMQNTETTIANQATTLNNANTVKSEKISIKKAKLVKKLVAKEGSAKIEKMVYVLLAIIGLGWLGMGLNDNFGGSKWIISLILYFLFYFPGLIYTLIKMKDYY